MQPDLFVVMRSKNDAKLIGNTLKSLYHQNYTGKIQVVHIDSGSTDETIHIIQQTNPYKLIHIQANEYIPGKVINQGMRETNSDWVVFLNSDAEPANENWLNKLIEAVENQENVGAAFSRQIPRKECFAVFAHDYIRCFGTNRELPPEIHFFSMVSCIIKRSVWEKFSFREDLFYAEDNEWSKRIKDNGHKVLYVPESIAIHSHNYTLYEAYKRSYSDCFASSATSTIPAKNYNWLYTVFFGALMDIMRDLRYCWRTKQILQWPHAIVVRLMQRIGKLRGYRAGWIYYKRDQ